MSARLAVGLAIAAGLALFIGANVHLVYVAVTSQPECLPTDPTSPPARKSC